MGRLLPALLLLAVAPVEVVFAEAPNPSPTAPASIDKLQALADTTYLLHESALLDQTYHLYVRVPPIAREEPERRFPTVYLLDGGATFPMLAGYLRYLELGEEVPPTIVVGISYGTTDHRLGNQRSRDFTAPSEERSYWGGAAKFQQVLAKELFPWVERTFPSDASRRIVFGQSLGGQFALYTAQTRPDLFWGHIASNPALHRNLDFFLRTRPQDPGEGERSRLFVSSGSDDAPRFREPAVKWIEHWGAIERPPWELETRTLLDHGHFSAAPVAFREGMRWLFDETDEAQSE